MCRTDEPIDEIGHRCFESLEKWNQLNFSMIKRWPKLSTLDKYYYVVRAHVVFNWFD